MSCFLGCGERQRPGGASVPAAAVGASEPLLHVPGLPTPASGCNCYSGGAASAAMELGHLNKIRSN